MKQFSLIISLLLGGTAAFGGVPDRGELLYGAGRFGNARMEFERKADMPTPEGLEAAAHAADCLFMEGQYKEAAAAYSAIPTELLSPSQEAQCSLNHAICLIQTGEVDQAYKLLEVAMGNKTTASTARYYLGTLAYDDGDFNRARELFRGVGAGGDYGTDAQIYLARIEYMCQNWHEAESESARLLRMPSLTESQRLELERINGEALYRLDRRSAAMDRLRPYVRKAPVPELSALYLVGLADYEDGDYDSALEKLEPVAEEGEGSMRQSAYLIIGQALLRQGDRDGALLAFRNASVMTDDPATRETALYNYAVAGLQGTVPFGSGTEPFEEYLREFPAGPHADRVRELLVASYMTENNYDEALRRVEAIRNPSADVLKAKTRILYNLASRAYRKGDYATARRHIQAAATASKYDVASGAEMVLLEAQMLSAEGKTEDAIKKYEQYLREAPRAAANRPVASYMLGYALLGEGLLTRADKSFADAATAYSGDATVSADILNRRGDIRYYSSQFGPAANFYSQAYEASRQTGDYALYNLARMQGFQRLYSEKLRTIESFEREFPKSVLMPSVLIEKAQAQIASGSSADAIPTLARVIAEYGNSPIGRNAYIQKAMTEAEIGRIDDAVATYEALITNYPTSEAAAQASPLLKNLLVNHDRPEAYLTFIQSIPDAPAPDAVETDELTYRSTMKEYRSTPSVEVLEGYLSRFPDGIHAAEVLELAAEQLYSEDHIPEAVARWEEVERKAGDAETATRARLGQMRGARDMGDYERAGAVADAIIGSTASGLAITEAKFTRAQAYSEAGQTEQAIELWQELADDPMSEIGAKSAFFAADALNESGRSEVALQRAKALTASGTPYHYWVARAFILTSDILRDREKDFQAREYLQALRQNYPGTETDIFDMIDTRLNSPKE